jgi:hypothetical protein
VIYTTIGKPRENDRFAPVYLQFERFRAAEYVRELSGKVWNGMMKLAEQGYWTGGAPPYGLQRLLLDEKREPVHVLEKGKRKAIQNQRVTLVPGDPAEVAVVQRIFHEFVELLYSEYLIAERLNADGILSAKGYRWTAGMVIARLQNEKYVGTMVYNRTTKKLKTPTRHNPPEQWVRTAEAFEGVIELEQFLRAQEIFAERRRKYLSEEMLKQLHGLQHRYGLWHPSLVRLLEDAPSPSTFAHRFGGLDHAFQQLYREPRDKARQLVHDQISQQVSAVLPYSDFLVLDEKLTVSVQPAVPMLSGYTAYWPFRPDNRQMIDITLGVLLSHPDDFDILGYVAMPRLLAGNRRFRAFATSSRTDMFGRCDLDFLHQLL